MICDAVHNTIQFNPINDFQFDFDFQNNGPNGCFLLLIQERPLNTPNNS